MRIKDGRATMEYLSRRESRATSERFTLRLFPVSRQTRFLAARLVRRVRVRAPINRRMNFTARRIKGDEFRARNPFRSIRASTGRGVNRPATKPRGLRVQDRENEINFSRMNRNEFPTKEDSAKSSGRNKLR